jgi:transaldolase
LKPDVHSVASVFISRWDKAVMDKVPEAVRDRLGIAVAQQTYKAYLDGTPTTAAALQPAVDLVERGGAELAILHIATAETGRPVEPRYVVERAAVL